MLQSKMTLPAEKTEEYLKGKEEMLSNTIRMTEAIRVELSVMMGCLSLNTIFSSREGLSLRAALTQMVLAGLPKSEIMSIVTDEIRKLVKGGK